MQEYTIDLAKALEMLLPEHKINCVYDPADYLQDWVEKEAKKPLYDDDCNHEIAPINEVKRGGAFDDQNRQRTDFCTYTVYSGDTPIAALLECAVEIQVKSDPLVDNTGSVHSGNWKYRND